MLKRLLRRLGHNWLAGRGNLKRILTIVALLVLMFAVTFFYLFNETNDEYNDYLYKSEFQYYSQAVSKRLSEYKTAMAVTEMNTSIRSKLFNEDVSLIEMSQLSTELGRMINSTTYAVTRGDSDIKQYFYAYLPGDGRYFFPLSQLPQASWYAAYQASLENGGNLAYYYSPIAQKYKMVMVNPINNFNTSDSLATEVCYSVFEAEVASLLPETSLRFPDASADISLFTQDGTCLYQSQSGSLDAARQALAAYQQQPGKKVYAAQAGFAVADLQPESDLILILLVPRLTVGWLLGNVNQFFFIALFIAVILVVGLLYELLIYRKRVDRLITSLDRFSENQSEQPLPEAGAGEEIQLIARHTVMMQNRIVHLIREEYKIKLQAAYAEYEALSAYINPHYLYNTLNTISGMAKLERADSTDRMILALSDLFRYLSDSGPRQVKIAEEVEAVKAYLYIQGVRYKNRFVYSIRLSEPVSRQLVPKLILQPLVENCFKHGLSRRHSRQAPFKISIKAFQAGPCLKIWVRDNGEGIAAEQLKQLRLQLAAADAVPETSAGALEKCVGLLNVHRRLKLAYGPASGLKIYSHSGRGTGVLILIRQDQSSRKEEGYPWQQPEC
ncbi:histidine kinase [Oscillospiraceae bacterium HV4-5-C5C]|nr:histidine kinase [Oscillospiraceae bacterium HV4-5-C5C]